MTTMPLADSRELRVGLVVLAALAALATGLLVLGDKSNLFARKNEYFVRFGSSSGLAKGNQVTLDGVNVGTVARVDLPEDPGRSEIDVWFKIDRRYAARLRTPMPPVPDPHTTRAQIKTFGLLGDKYLELNSGSERYPEVPDGGQIPAAAPSNLEHLVASGEDVMVNVAQISHSLQNILARMDRGEGLLGELTTESASGRQIRQSAIATMQSLQRLTDKMETGGGLFPRLVNDRQLANRLASAVEQLDAVLASARHGAGPLPALLNDAGEKARLEETLANLSAATAELKTLAGRLEKGQGLVPRLFADDAYGREMAERLQRTVEHLDTVSDRLVEGNGTAARLINDPSLYEAIDDIIVGANHSWMLRWLIQNRQKAGIKKRYHDAIAAPSVPPPGEP
jgi:phospholipid/cholesterol/gamma-HCH transport system substrate-binding protein